MSLSISSHSYMFLSHTDHNSILELSGSNAPLNWPGREKSHASQPFAGQPPPNGTFQVRIAEVDLFEVRSVEEHLVNSPSGDMLPSSWHRQELLTHIHPGQDKSCSNCKSKKTELRGASRGPGQRYRPDQRDARKRASQSRPCPWQRHRRPGSAYLTRWTLARSGRR